MDLVGFAMSYSLLFCHREVMMYMENTYNRAISPNLPAQLACFGRGNVLNLFYFLGVVLDFFLSISISKNK